jgi:hypothetical protein
VTSPKAFARTAGLLYLTPNFDESSVTALLMPGGSAEIALVLWLSIRGANAPAQGADNDPHVGIASGTVWPRRGLSGLGRPG